MRLIKEQDTPWCIKHSSKKSNSLCKCSNFDFNSRIFSSLKIPQQGCSSFTRDGEGKSFGCDLLPINISPQTRNILDSLHRDAILYSRSNKIASQRARSKMHAESRNKLHQRKCIFQRVTSMTAKESFLCGVENGGLKM